MDDSLRETSRWQFCPPGRRSETGCSWCAVAYLDGRANFSVASDHGSSCPARSLGKVDGVFPPTPAGFLALAAFTSRRRDLVIGCRRPFRTAPALAAAYKGPLYSRASTNSSMHELIAAFCASLSMTLATAELVGTRHSPPAPSTLASCERLATANARWDLDARLESKWRTVALLVSGDQEWAWLEYCCATHRKRTGRRHAAWNLAGDCHPHRNTCRRAHPAPLYLPELWATGGKFNLLCASYG